MRDAERKRAIYLNFISVSRCLDAGNNAHVRHLRRPCHQSQFTYPDVKARSFPDVIARYVAQRDVAESLANFSSPSPDLTFGTNNPRIAEIRRRVADVFCFRLGEVLVRIYEDDLGGKALRKRNERVGKTGWRTKRERERDDEE